MASHDSHHATGPVGPAPKEHQVVYTTLHFDKPWSYENYLKTGGYSALRKILEEKIPPEQVIEMVKASVVRSTTLWSRLIPSMVRPLKKQLLALTSSP